MTVSAFRPPTALPAWPLTVALAGLPLWWVLGLWPFLPLLYAAVLTLLLLSARRSDGIRVLPGTGPLWGLVLWALACMLMLDSPLRVVGFAIRWGALLAAALVLVHVANCSALTERRLLLSLVPLWVLLIIGGYLGVLMPGGGFTTPLARVLPGAVMANEFVGDLLRPAFAEVQHPWGAAAAFNRPSAPFAYTNGWGCAFALLTPLMLAARRHLRTRLARGGVLFGIAISVVPAAMTRNRGMLIMASVVLVAYTVGLLLRGNFRALVGAVTGGAIAVGAFAGLGVTDLIAERAAVSDSAGGRARIYAQTWEATLQSPVLGFGAPRGSDEIGIALGTQGALWMYLFSYGIPGVLFFIAFLGGVIARGAALPSRAHLWVLSAVVGVAVGGFFYGLDGIHLLVLAVACALILRARAEQRAGPQATAGPTRASAPSAAGVQR